MRTKKVDFLKIYIYKTQNTGTVPQVAGTVDSHTGDMIYISHIYFTHYTRVYHVRVNMYTYVCMYFLIHVPVFYMYT